MKTVVVERDPSGKKDEPHASISKEGSDRMDRLVITGTLPACANFNTSQDCKYGGSASIRIERKEDKFWSDCGTIPGQCDVSAETAKVGSTTIYDYRKLSGNSE